MGRQHKPREEIRFEDFESRFGVPAPGALHEIIAGGGSLEDLGFLPWRSIIDLDDLYPSVLPRFLPVYGVGDGDLLGLHIPRDGGAMFAAWWGHEESRIAPLTSDLDRFFRDPGHFSPDEPGWDRLIQHAKDHDPAWLGLRADPTVAAPELELLKPLFRHREEVEHDPERAKQFGFPPPSDRSVEKLLDRFPSGSDPASRAVARQFRAMHDLRFREKWLSLAGDLTRLGRPVDALRALENGIFVHFLYPWNGEPRRKDSIGRLWPNILEFYEAMAPLAKKHGDAFDRASLPHQLRRAREFVRGS